MGAIAVKLLTSEHLDQYVTLTGGQRVHVDMHVALSVNAKRQVQYLTIKTGVAKETFGHIVGHCYSGQRLIDGPFDIPPPRAPKGSTVKLPFTFIGDHRLGARKWLRVATHGDSEENREIQRGLQPARLVMNVLLHRFGILKLKHPLIVSKESLLVCVPVLHNYFMQMNPAYEDLEMQVREIRLDPESIPPPQTEAENKPKAETARVKEAMLRMKMNEESLQTLKQKTGMPSMVADTFLLFIGVGQFEEKNTCALSGALGCIFRGLSEYWQQVS